MNWKLILVVSLLACLTSSELFGQAIDENHPLVDKAKNLALYAVHVQRPSVGQIEKWAGDKATVGVEEGDEANWKRLIVRWPESELVINSESVADGDLFEHLENFRGYVFNQLAQNKMDAHVYSVIKQIARTNHLYVMQAGDGGDAMNLDAIKLAQLMAISEKAMVFESVGIYDDRLRELLGENKSRDQSAKVPAFESGSARKTRTMESLADRGLKPIEHLPEIMGDEGVRLRDPELAARRFLCLAAVAMKADSRGKFDAREFVKKHQLSDYLSPAEAEYIAAEEGPNQNVSMTWRYESAWALLWALKHADEIGFPNSQTDAKTVITAALENAETILKDPELRPVAELMDQADLLYRCNWLCTEARNSGNADAKDLSGSVVYERLYALNWLINNQNETNWDDVVVDS